MWNQGRLGYYADFAIVPLLMLFAVWVDLAYRGPSAKLAVLAALGYAVWTLLEYWIHRSLFHVVMRRDHWLHHKQPRGWVSAPWYLSGLLHVLALGALITTTTGTGLFLGLEAGYLGYIVVHDRIHHGMRSSAYIRRRGALHDVHHTYGSERNFGVASSFWDHVFGTHFEPRRT